MNKFITLAALGLCFSSINAQEAKEEKKAEEGFVFTTIKENPITSISSVAFLESELLRQGKGEFDLSEMFIVHHTMEDRAVNYVRYHGDASFSPGGSFEDMVVCYEKYGMVPQNAMPGIMYGDSLPVHNELDAVAGAYVEAIGKGKFSKLTPVWKNGLRSIYDTYLGECPKEFNYNGKTYTPRTFADEVLKLNMNDYISLTSYTHHPFYTQFNVEVQDNWRKELMEVMDNAVRKGYTFAWGSDVSEQGFTRDGIAVFPDASKGAELTGSDMAHWLGLSAADKRKELTSKPLPEVTVTQEMRQTAFDNWETTDDHGMLIYGLAKDQNGKEYFMVKNSWGEAGKYKGIWYASKAFVAYKTMNILVHKDAIPSKIAKKLGLK